MKEIWKDVEGYESYYQISNLGRVFSKRTNRILKSSYSGKYLSISTRIEGKCRNLKIHRLVASAFIKNQDNKSVVNHIDGNKENNVYTNLEWSTYAENSQHAARTGLIKSKYSPMSMQIANDMREMKRTTSFTGKKIADHFNINYEVVKRVLTNKMWKE